MNHGTITAKPSGANIKLKDREQCMKFIEEKKAAGFNSRCVYHANKDIEVMLLHKTEFSRRYEGMYIHNPKS